MNNVQPQNRNFYIEAPHRYIMTPTIGVKTKGVEENEKGRVKRKVEGSRANG